MELVFKRQDNEFEDLSFVIEAYMDFISNGMFDEYVKYKNVDPRQSAKVFFSMLQKHYGWKPNKRNPQARKIMACVNFLNMANNVSKGLEQVELSDLDREDIFLFLADSTLKRELLNLKAKKNSQRQMQILEIALRMHEAMYKRSVIVKQQVDKTNAKIEQIFTDPEHKMPVPDAVPIPKEYVEQYKKIKGSETKVQNSTRIIKDFMQNADAQKGNFNKEVYAQEYVDSYNLPANEVQPAITTVLTTTAIYSAGNQVVNGVAVELTDVEKRGMAYMSAHPNYEEITAAVKAAATSEYQQTVNASAMQIAEELQPYAIAEQIAVFEATEHLREVVSEEMLVHHNNMENDYGMSM